jgi:ribosomal protein S9
MIQTSTNFNHKSRSKYKNTFGKRKSAKVFLWVNFAKKKGQKVTVPLSSLLYQEQNKFIMFKINNILKFMKM